RLEDIPGGSAGEVSRRIPGKSSRKINPFFRRGRKGWPNHSFFLTSRRLSPSMMCVNGSGLRVCNDFTSREKAAGKAALGTTKPGRIPDNRKGSVGYEKV